MDGKAFENDVADLMRGFGWDVAVTPASNDYGADVICALGATKLVIQCKCYGDGNYVGGEAIKEAYAAMAHYNAGHGLVVYRGRPSKQARLWAASTGVQLFHLNELTVGWAFDRTREGAEARKRREVQAEREQRKEEQLGEQRYRAAIAYFDSELAAWRKRSESHERYKDFSRLALIAGVVACLAGGIPLGVAALFFAAYAYWGTLPGFKPSLPEKPAHMEAVSTERTVGLDAPLQRRPISVRGKDATNTANYLQLLGFDVRRRSYFWVLTDKRGKVRELSDEQLISFAKSSHSR